MSDKKVYFICTVIIFFGVLFISLVWNMHNKYIGLPVGVLGFLLIIGGLRLMAGISEKRLKEKYAGYEKPVQITSQKEKIFHYAGFVAGCSCIIAFNIAGRYFDNTIHGDSFFLVSAVAGLTCAGIYYYLLKFIYPSFFKMNEQRQLSIFITCLAIIGWTVTGLAYYNASTAKQISTIKTVLVSKSKNANSRSLYAFLLIDGQKERFSPVKKEWETLNEGDSVALETGKGNLDYSYVFHFKKVEK